MRVLWICVFKIFFSDPSLCSVLFFRWSWWRRTLRWLVPSPPSLSWMRMKRPRSRLCRCMRTWSRSSNLTRSMVRSESNALNDNEQLCVWEPKDSGASALDRWNVECWRWCVCSLCLQGCSLCGTAAVNLWGRSKSPPAQAASSPTVWDWGKPCK